MISHGGGKGEGGKCSMWLWIPAAVLLRGVASLVRNGATQVTSGWAVEDEEGVGRSLIDWLLFGER